MMFIKAKCTDGTVEIFNLDKVLNITPHKSGVSKILMGAGLYWNVYSDSIEPIYCYNEIIDAITEAHK